MVKHLVKIFTKHNSPRLNYIAGILIGDILGLPWEVITDRRKLGKHPVINYSTDKINGSFSIVPAPLLFETGVNKQEISIDTWNGLPVFFRHSAESDFPFDIFAASFYLVSRYEEYLDFQPDEHGRFQASTSLAFKNGFLGIPVIDFWARELSRSLIRKFPSIAFKRNEFRALLTVDADEPFAYLGRNVIRSFGGLLRDLTLNTSQAGDRYKVVRHEKKDPYQVFDYIKEIIRKNNIEARFFFPVGDLSKFDRNPSWKNDEYRELITSIASEFNVGLHPSYRAGGELSLVEQELLRLKTVVSKEVGSSRFHFLRLSMPASYSCLARALFTEDYSMGYADEPGFRAGIARPYPFYNIMDEIQTNLKIVPFQVMDMTLLNHKKLDPSRAIEVILKLISATRAAGGLFTSIWHNTSLQESSEGKEWRKVFETMVTNMI